MRQYINQVLSTHTFRQSAVTAVSTFLTSALGAVYYLLLARVLGPAEYGLFSLALVVLQVGVNVADLGTGQALVKFISSHASKDQYFPYAKIGFVIKTLTGLATVVAFTVFASPLATIIFHKPQLAPLLPLAGWGILSVIWMWGSLAIFQGLQRFWLWGSLQVGSNILRLILLFVPWLFWGQLNSRLALLIFAAPFFIGFGFSWLWLDIHLLRAKANSTHWIKFWQFSAWTAAFSALSALTSRLEVILSGRFLTLSQVGIYSLAATMVSFLPQLSTAIGTVTTAKFAGFTDQATVDRYLKKATWFVGAVSLAAALTMIPVALAVVWFAGRQNYSAAIYPFLVLLLGTVVFMFTNPIRDCILYYYSRPKFSFWSTLGQAIVVVTTGFWLIPTIGIMGSALSASLGLFFVSLCSIYYHSKLRYESS